MRVVFVGASRLGINTARLLLKAGHDVVIIESDADNAEMLSSELGCGVIHGDGSKPVIQRESDPHASDFLFCLTSNDQTNIIASLIGRSLGFRNVVTRIDDPEFEHICIELGLENTIIPSRAISRQLCALVEGETPLSISALIKHDAALFSFVVPPEDAVEVGALGLPADCRLILVYRGEKFMIADDSTELKAGDEAIVLCHRSSLPELHERWIEVDEGSG
jgi:trk system potassium uptake protein TrkA